YIDRTLKGGNLIQAYSRTNRIHDRDAKPQGNIVNYRWPIQNEYEMNKSFAIYSNRDSAAEQLSLDELKKDNEESGILSKSFSKIESETKEVIQKLAELTDNFIQLPPSEKAQEEVLKVLQEYKKRRKTNNQYTKEEEKKKEDGEEEKELFYDRLGITEDQEVMLTTVLANE
ncbi:type I restriction endonuclease subunit R, partial [Enterococcus faecium]|nr:type I restriction endonuclease subunit R [Enterococcus faecium]